MDLAAEYIAQYGYIAITILLALGIIGLPIPDETLMLFIGYLASTGVLNYLLCILFSFIGSVAGMLVSYIIGNKLGFRVVDKYGKWIGLNPKRFDRVQKWFVRYGIWTVLFSYFVPGVRHAAGYIAGISAMPFRKYLLICTIGAVVWTVLFISIGYVVGLKVVA